MRSAGKLTIVAAALIAGYLGGAQAAQTAGNPADLLVSPAIVHSMAKQPVGPEAGVTDAMLKAGTDDPQSWLQYGGDYRNFRHSPIKALNPAAVRKLKVAWSFPTGTTGQFEVSPVVYGGVMFVTTSYNRLFALDAKTGELLWR